jgi:two-component system chemotaxis response regulator CheB
VGLLQLHSRIKVKEPEDKETVRQGFVYIAPADYHLMIEEEAFSLSTDAPILSARPSIDVLFESAAEACDEGVIGVVLTGASADGAIGSAKIKQRGGILIVQDPDEAESAVMPRAACKAAKADYVARLCEIGPLLVKLIVERDAER